MNNNLINSEIKRTSKNLFLVNFILLIISIVVLVYFWSEFHNFILGPKDVKIGEISNLNISGFSARNYVKVSPDKMVSTGLQYIEKEYDNNNNETNKTVKSVYYVFRDGQNLIIASIPPDEADKSSYTGWVREMTPDENYNLNQDINTLKASGNYAVSEYILDAEKDFFAPFMYAVSIIIIIVNVINIIRSTKYIKCLENHKIYKKLMKYGNVDMVINNIEGELTNDAFSRSKKIHLLSSWIIISKFFSFEVIKIDDVVWVYKKVTKHSVNFIPTGKTYESILRLNNKSKYFIKLGEKDIDYLLSSIKEIHPYIVVGYSKDIERMYNSEFPRFVNYV